jgi:hypothetical protein
MNTLTWFLCGDLTQTTTTLRRIHVTMSLSRSPMVTHHPQLLMILDTLITLLHFYPGVPVASGHQVPHWLRFLTCILRYDILHRVFFLSGHNLSF